MTEGAPGPGPVQPGFGPRRDPGEAARVKALVRAIVGDEFTVMVTELACTEPGCPPVETVIALMHPGAPDQRKIHKALAAVTADDVAAALAGAGSGSRSGTDEHLDP